MFAFFAEIDHPVQMHPLRHHGAQLSLSRSPIGRRIGILAAAAGLTAGLAVSLPTTAEASDSPEGVVMAVSGLTTDHGYWRESGTGRWTNGRGTLKPGVGVAQSGSITHLVGTDDQGRLVHRTNRSSWHALTDTACNSPTIVTSKDTVHGACVGSNGTPQAFSFKANDQHPSVSLKGLGGQVTSVAVAVDRDGPVYFANGNGYRIPSTGATGNVYVRYPSSAGWERWDARCTGPVAAAITAKRATVACQDYERVRVEIFMPRNENSILHKLKGSTSGKMAVVPTGDGSSAMLLAQGRDGVPRHQRIDDTGGAGSWAAVGGGSRGGVAGASVKDLTP
ncbi:MAG: hypothetical protein CSA58_06685 [Micrococcales bacterium]|nr:MAG: hypothetical protein CSB46_03700 [Micrococcales bacterium]PIE26977.1 MAG: hypothetical protein CSA58_06685 [Micrococcales bacterium]